MKTQCIAINLRRAMRLVNRIYEEEFRGYEITSMQFAVFASLGVHGQMSCSDLARELNADISTVNRNMEILEERSFVEKRIGKDKRVRVYSLTDLGRGTLQRGVPRWRTAQKRVLAIMGEEAWEPMRETLEKLHEMEE
jgi:DNA-binding MarR family transcriptional regulator